VTIRALTAPNPGPFTLDGTKSWLVGGEAVIDPGPVIDEHVAAIESALPDLRTILVTHRHPDHAPAARMLHDRTGAEILAPRGVFGDDLDHRVLEDGEIIDLGGLELEVIATPGHTAEHVCFLTRDGALFTGDMVLGHGTTVILPPDGDMGDYVESLRDLLARDPATIYPGHGPVRDDAKALLEEYIAHRMLREKQVVDGLRGGATTIAGLRARIYPELVAALHAAAEMQMRAHLDLLMRKGTVVEDDGGFRLV